MNLLSLRKKVKTAQKGHKLLKDKRDGLMKKFMEIIRRARELRQEVEKHLGDAFALFLESSRLTNPKAIKNALSSPEVTLLLSVRTKNVMSVHIPDFEAQFSGSALTFGGGVSENLALSIQKFQEIFPLLLELAGVEKSAESLAEEIEKTRRRVNALEYRLIPDLIETVRFIRMKLEEGARSSLVSVMRIKSMIQKKERIAQMSQEN
jgi:V/A-type H+/Na+-transporting ATPase subunit D